MAGLSEEGFSEANTEQRTRINCKNKVKFLINLPQKCIATNMLLFFLMIFNVDIKSYRNVVTEKDILIYFYLSLVF